MLDLIGIREKFKNLSKKLASMEESGFVSWMLFLGLNDAVAIALYAACTLLILPTWLPIKGVQLFFSCLCDIVAILLIVFAVYLTAFLCPSKSDVPFLEGITRMHDKFFASSLGIQTSWFFMWRYWAWKTFNIQHNLATRVILLVVFVCAMGMVWYVDKKMLPPSTQDNQNNLVTVESSQTVNLDPNSEENAH